MTGQASVPPLRSRTIHDGWQLRPLALPPGAPDVLDTETTVAATVPGCVHTDLLDAGLIPDPYLDRNELGLRWIGETDWEYATTFRWADDGSREVDLVCAGLDTVAVVVLNGVEVGRSTDMHRTHRFGVRDVLSEGDNHLVVRFAAPLLHAARLEEERGALPRADVYPEAYNQIRKMACNFGWDWGPQLVTAGIWRDLTLESWSGVRVAAVRPHVTVAGSAGRVEVDVDLAWADDGTLTEAQLTATVADVSVTAPVPAGAATVRMTLDITEIERWWPVGYGEPRRYDLDVTLADGDIVDRRSTRIGFRNVHIDTDADAIGSRWQLVVNDVPIWVRGANWIPDDCFPTRVEADRYRRRIDQAVDADMNLLRVWGGGIYESDDFYEICDELGVMVWQDFLFACAAYPESPDVAADVEAEARDNVTRLMSHPALVVWNGNNENLWGYEDWGWKEALDGRPWGAGYYFDLLPAVVAELDPTRPYVPGSPYSPPGIHPNDLHHGTSHLWDVWNELDYTEYRRSIPRFVAEFGYQGPPTFATLRRSISDVPLTPTSPGMLHHQKAADGAGKLHRGLTAHFPEPADFDDWHFLTQVNQARAIALGVEHLRANRDVCSGAVVWQLNDCWPVTSWAAVDGDGRRKPLWYALRRAFADRLVTVQPDREGLRAVVVVDGREGWSGTIVARRVRLDGTVIAEDQHDFEVEAGSARSWSLPPALARPDDANGELLVVGAEGLRSWWSWVRDRDLHYPQAQYHSSVAHTPDGSQVTVIADSLLRDLSLLVDRTHHDAEVDDMLVTLLPGESHTFDVTGVAGLDPAQLTTRPVLRVVNDVADLHGDAAHAGS